MSEWISIKDRRPRHGETVAILGVEYRIRKIRVAWYHKHLPLWVVETHSGFRPFAGKVTHWMPLPEPPKED